MTTRRELITMIGGAAAAWPVAVRAQQGAIPVIGYLSSRSHDTEAAVREPFFKALEEAGFFVGKNIAVEYRYSEGQEERGPKLAADLVSRKVSMLVATDRPSALVAKAATSTIPIVFTSGDDPVKLGLVASLSNPGGNATGIYLFTTQLGPKRLGLLRDFLAKPTLIAFVVNPNNTSTPLQIEEMQAAASAVGQPLLVLRAGTEREVEDAFVTMAQQNVGAVLYGTNTFYQVIGDHLVSLAARYKIPASYEWRDSVVAGGLMSYNAD